jgi:hypothetical protein
MIHSSPVAVSARAPIYTANAAVYIGHCGIYRRAESLAAPHGCWISAIWPPIKARIKTATNPAVTGAAWAGPARGPQPFVNRSSASRYFAAVFSITSCGRRGAGGVLSQGLPLMRTCSSQSRTNCLS